MKLCWSASAGSPEPSGACLPGTSLPARLIPVALAHQGYTSKSSDDRQVEPQVVKPSDVVALVNADSRIEEAPDERKGCDPTMPDAPEEARRRSLAGEARMTGSASCQDKKDDTNGNDEDYQ